MKVLLTGGSGFVGARVARQLVAQGHEVALLLREGSDTRRIGDLLPQCTVIRGDMGRCDSLRAPVAEFGPQAVAHLAWAGVKGADRNSVAQMHNVAHSIELFQLALDVGCRRFVGLGSQAEYGPQSGRIDEQAPLRPTTAYGAAKLATGLVLERTAAASGVALAWLRLFSSYGPDDDPSWLIPYMTTRLLAGEKPSLTKAEQVWDYIFVDDAAAAVVAALGSSAHGMFNLGSGVARPLRDIVTSLRDLIDPTLPLGFGEVAYRPDQVMHLEADISALTAATGWRPVTSLADGIAQTVAWHRRQPPGRADT